MKVSPADINIGDRVRQNVDDGLHELVESIRDLGQLQPVLVDSDWNLIAGYRRLRACEILGIDVDITITTTLEDAGRKLLAERDENTCRKPFTPSEAVEMARRIEAVLKPSAKRRMEAGHNQHTEGSAKFAEGSTGEVREIAAAATGFSRESIRKAAVVKEAAEAADAAPEVVAAKAEMDATGKVDSAYKTVKAAQQMTSPSTADGSAPKPKLSGDLAYVVKEVSRIVSSAGGLSEQERRDAALALHTAVVRAHPDGGNTGSSGWFGLFWDTLLPSDKKEVVEVAVRNETEAVQNELWRAALSDYVSRLYTDEESPALSKILHQFRKAITANQRKLVEQMLQDVAPPVRLTTASTKLVVESIRRMRSLTQREQPIEQSELEFELDLFSAAVKPVLLYEIVTDEQDIETRRVIEIPGHMIDKHLARKSTDGGAE